VLHPAELSGGEAIEGSLAGELRHGRQGGEHARFARTEGSDTLWKGCELECWRGGGRKERRMDDDDDGDGDDETQR